MTLSEAYEKLRQSRLSESANSQSYPTPFLKGLLRDAELIVHSVLNLVTASHDVVLDENDDIIEFPEEDNVMDLMYNEVVIGKRHLILKPKYFVLMTKELTHYPMYYYFDTRDSDRQIEFAPRIRKPDIPAIFRYVVRLPNTEDEDELWLERYPEFHDIVVDLAAVFAFDAGYEYEYAQRYEERLRNRLGEFAVFLRKPNVAERIIGSRRALRERHGATDEVEHELG